MDFNLLTLNLNKSNFVTFSFNKKGLPSQSTLKVHSSDCSRLNCTCNLSICRKESVKYLGVHFDQHMRWSNHCEYVTGRLRKLIYKFYQLRQVLSLKQLRMVYVTLAESLMSYGIIAWGSACKTVLHSLYVTQKHIIKVIMFKRRMFPTNLLFQQSKLLNIRLLFIKDVIRYSMVRKLFTEMVDHNILTRAVVHSMLVVPGCAFSATQRHISYLGPKILNILPVELKNRKYSAVKKHITEWLLDNADIILGRMAIIDI